MRSVFFVLPPQWLQPVLTHVRGEAWMPSLNESSAATRAWPHIGFSRAMRTINARISRGKGACRVETSSARTA